MTRLLLRQLGMSVASCERVFFFMPAYQKTQKEKNFLAAVLKLRQDGAFTEQCGRRFLHLQKLSIEFATSVLNFIVFSVFIASPNLKKSTNVS